MGSVMESIHNSVFLVSIIIFVETLMHLSRQITISIKIYKYIAYVLLISTGIFICVFTYTRWITGNGMSSMALFVYVCIHSIIATMCICYIIKKNFQCTTWYPYIIFSLLTISLYTIPIFLGTGLVIVLYGLH